MTFQDLPTLNAALNTASAVLLLAGWWLIRHGRRDAHRRAMLLAVASSTLFLVSYLAYHFEVGSVRFTGQGPIRTVYFVILVGHTVLAAAIVPLVLVTLTARAARPLRRAPRPRTHHPPAVAVGVRVRRRRLLDAVPALGRPALLPADPVAHAQAAVRVVSADVADRLGELRPRAPDGVRLVVGRS